MVILFDREWATVWGEGSVWHKNSKPSFFLIPTTTHCQISNMFIAFSKFWLPQIRFGGSGIRGFHYMTSQQWENKFHAKPCPSKPHNDFRPGWLAHAGDTAIGEGPLEQDLAEKIASCALWLHVCGWSGAESHIYFFMRPIFILKYWWGMARGH